MVVVTCLLGCGVVLPVSLEDWSVGLSGVSIKSVLHAVGLPVCHGCPYISLGCESMSLAFLPFFDHLLRRTCSVGW